MPIICFRTVDDTPYITNTLELNPSWHLSGRLLPWLNVAY